MHGTTDSACEIESRVDRTLAKVRRILREYERTPPEKRDADLVSIAIMRAVYREMGETE